MTEFKFNIVDTTLENDIDFTYLNLSNKYYDVQIVYANNYFKDKQANKIQKEWISLVCTPKKCLVNLNYVSCAGVCVKFDYTTFSPLNQTDKIQQELTELKKHLDIAQQSGEELQKVLNEYFLKYTTE